MPTVSQQVLTESIDAARTTLLHLARSHSLRTVMVTSAVSGEGKTSLSCHLAASLARAGLRVLLIDADMRNPSAHKLFGLQSEVGFSELLCGEASVADCVQETSLRNLSLLPAGQWSDETAAALNQGQAAVLFEQFRQQFDIIVVDSSPVLPVADALLIGQQVDGVVLSVLCEVSRLNNLYAAWQRVQEHGGQPLGVVINGVSGGKYGSYANYPYPRRPKAKA
jgi:capsular exopolysaccharide synthesis family protein